MERVKFKAKNGKELEGTIIQMYTSFEDKTIRYVIQTDDKELYRCVLENGEYIELVI